MIDDKVVVDAVVHPYNLAPDNQNPDAHAQLEVTAPTTKLWTPDRREC
jgi:hypothetical protein